MRIKLWCVTHDVDSLIEDIIEVPDDTTEKDLNLEAQDFFWNEKKPDWGWEKMDNE